PAVRAALQLVVRCFTIGGKTGLQDFVVQKTNPHGRRCRREQSSEADQQQRCQKLSHLHKSHVGKRTRSRKYSIAIRAADLDRGLPPDESPEARAPRKKWQQKRRSGPNPKCQARS